MNSIVTSLGKLSAFFGKTFALWVIIFACIAYNAPSYFTFLAPYISILLGIVMFGMGLTLRAKDFSEVFTRPLEVIIGILGQFIIMPLTAWGLCKVLGLSDEIAVGVILVGCCPGGTASNVMTYLGKGDVPLSVTVSSCTTVLAPIVTPALIYLFANQWVDVDPYGMFMSIVNIVILPIVAGVIINSFFGKFVRNVVVALPLISVFAIVAIVIAVVAVSQQKIAETGLIIFAVVVLHNGLGLALGYFLAKVCGMSVAKRKAISMEVGMQNSGLGVALAMAHFSPLSAVPSAIFSVWHNISGPILATIYANMKNSPEDDEKMNRKD
ncbi:bile acid:sodium symporter family protein [Succinatimonas hippei]|uniref:bile acid:sodium symporter family protein n=1 Tax=Succinatimonas hippei TaxID=626938 RepID=UPI0020117E51|nr:bile acid:sodium symporter family protein [Succinatimonas hippei]MCL1604290.1 bile acid:sodium symporter family protein [Succinatimonas hippei]MDM8119916.1 bile acid:sodium symporter family protein [Succinatimonas hippei]